MITNNELYNEEPSVGFRKLAYANLYCAKKLAELMEDDPSTIQKNIYYANVIMSLMYHAVELFLKYTITNKKKEVTAHHDLEILSNEYKELYPEEKYIWDIPFITEYLGFTEKEVLDIKNSNEEKTRKMTLEQRFRYPLNKNGQPWGMVPGFDIKEFLMDCNQIENDFKRIEKLISNPNSL